MKKLKTQLVRCKLCSNPFFRDENSTSKICENCIKLEERRKRTAALKVKQEEMQRDIDKMENQLKITMSQRKKEEIKKEIEERTFSLSKSIELLVKYEETGDEIYIEQYMNLFKLLKKNK